MCYIYTCIYIYMHMCVLSHFSLVIQCTRARQAPLSTGFSRQEQWSGLPCPPPGDLPNTGIEPTSPAAPILQADSLLYIYVGFAGGSDSKESTCNAGDPGLTPGVRKIPWRREWQPTLVFLGLPR